MGNYHKNDPCFKGNPNNWNRHTVYLMEKWVQFKCLNSFLVLSPYTIKLYSVLLSDAIWTFKFKFAGYVCDRNQREQPEGPDHKIVIILDMHSAGLSNLVRANLMH